MVDLARVLDQIHQTNQIVLYTDVLSSQIPRSYAGHAFRQFQQSMYLFELIRLAAMWDAPRGDRESIPTVRRLLQDQDVVALAVSRISTHYEGLGPVHVINEADMSAEAAEATRQMLQEERHTVARERSERAATYLADAIQQSSEIEKSEPLAHLVKLRGQAIAHNLYLSPPSDPDLHERWRYGGETDLLARTIRVIDLFHRGLNGSSFDWADMRRQHQRNAEDLWRGCAFAIPPH